MKPKVLIGFGKNIDSGLEATGLPPHIVLSSKVERLESKIDAIENYLKNEQSIHLTNEILSHCVINGAVPVTHQQLKEMMNCLEARIISNDRRITINFMPQSNQPME